MAQDGKIDLNTADADMLRRIEGVDEARARLIVAHRRQYGPFQSWEDFESVLGIGPVLAKNARAVATLGAFSPLLGGSGALGFGHSANEDDESLDSVEVLSTMARMDLEAALAYEASAEAALGTEELRSQLLRFRDDHLRHVLDLNRVLRVMGSAPILHMRLDTEQYLLRSLAKLARPFGPGALVLVLLTDEQMTNGIYELARELDWDDEVADLIERNAADEQRHLLWLSDKEDELMRHEGHPVQPS